MKGVRVAIAGFFCARVELYNKSSDGILVADNCWTSIVRVFPPACRNGIRSALAEITRANIVTTRQRQAMEENMRFSVSEATPTPNDMPDLLLCQ